MFTFLLSWARRETVPRTTGAYHNLYYFTSTNETPLSRPVAIRSHIPVTSIIQSSSRYIYNLLQDAFIYSHKLLKMTYTVLYNRLTGLLAVYPIIQYYIQLSNSVFSLVSNII